MTIKDIAKLAGYSVSTVSRVINDSPNVSEAARKKVLEVIEEHDFTPNKNARQLKQLYGNHVAVIVKGTQNLLFASIIEQVQSLFRKENFAATVYYIDEHANEVQQAIRLLREQKPLGILFLGGNLEYFQRDFHHIKVPCILVTTSAGGMGFDNLSSTTTDDVAGGAQAIEHLIQSGHREIAIIGGDLSRSVISQQRLAGCQQAFFQNKIDFSLQSQYATSRFSFEGGYQAMVRLLEQETKITAVFAMSDVMAIGAIRALADHGIRVPEEISVMGYDGTEYARYYTPSLTSIYQNQQQLAQRSVTLLLGQLQGGNGAVHEAIPFRLHKGESVLTQHIDA